MSARGGSASDTPRWVGAVWIWLPAVAGLLLFGGVAALQLSRGLEIPLWTLAGVACAGAQALRERRPVGALAVCLLALAAARLPGAGVLGSGFDAVYLLLLFVPVLPLVAVAGALPLRRSALALLATVVVTVAASPTPVWSTATYSTQSALAEYVLNLGVPTMIALGAWLAGCAMLERQRHAEGLLERAVSRERARDAEAARAVAEERARIARELHDVITHTVAVMVVQAAAAEAVWDRDPGQARASLRSVQETGRTVTADLRGMLGAMRADARADELRAQPGIEALPALVDQVRTTGVTARLTTSGSAAALTPATSLSLLRVAQESVTNALRHASAATIAIDLVIGERAVSLSVADDGVGCDATRSSADALDPQRLGGHGLIGMRERARVLGGTLDVAPRAAGGTVVTIRAPLGRETLT